MKRILTFSTVALIIINTYAMENRRQLIITDKDFQCAVKQQNADEIELIVRTIKIGPNGHNYLSILDIEQAHAMNKNQLDDLDKQGEIGRDMVAIRCAVQGAIGVCALTSELIKVLCNNPDISKESLAAAVIALGGCVYDAVAWWDLAKPNACERIKNSLEILKKMKIANHYKDN